MIFTQGLQVNVYFQNGPKFMNQVVGVDLMALVLPSGLITNPARLNNLANCVYKTLRAQRTQDVGEEVHEHSVTLSSE